MLCFECQWGLCRVQVGLRGFCTGLPCELAPVFSVHTDVAGKVHGGRPDKSYVRKGHHRGSRAPPALYSRSAPAASGGWLGLGRRLSDPHQSRRSPSAMGVWGGVGGSHGGGGGGAVRLRWVCRAPSSLSWGWGGLRGLLGQVCFFFFLITGMLAAPLPSVCPVEGWGLLFKT